MSALGRLLNDAYRRDYEKKAGRIKATPGGYVFNPPDWLLEKTHQCNPNLVINGKPTIVEKDADGKDMVLVSQRTIVCPIREGRDGIYPRGATGWYYPDRLCRKCQYRQKASRQYRFPRCTYRASENPKQEAAKEVLAMWGKAVDTANKMMGH